jgi:hypothetical protein
MAVSPIRDDSADPPALARVPSAQPVTTTTCVHEALAHLRITGETAAVVYRSGAPVGVVTAGVLARAAECGRAGAPVVTVMGYVTVAVDRHADSHATVRTFTDAAWRWLRQRRIGSH